jgi:shikimate dehydrogenase
MQGAAFAACGLHDWSYELWHTPLAELAKRIDRIRQDTAILGCNVTVPHKQNVFPLLDSYSDHARALGAVNTIVKRAGMLWGDNTDWRGFMADLAYHHATPTSGNSCLILGAGGSARGVAYGLLKHGCTVLIHNRNPARAEVLARDLQPYGDIRVAESLSLDRAAPGLIVNCTSAGMSPNEAGNPWPSDLPFPAGVTLYDLVYKPRTTTLMRTAEAAGARVISGIGMLAEQGAAAFELWTGIVATHVSSTMRDELATLVS